MGFSNGTYLLYDPRLHRQSSSAIGCLHEASHAGCPVHALNAEYLFVSSQINREGTGSIRHCLNAERLHPDIKNHF